MKTAGKKELAFNHLWRHDPVGHCLSRVFRQLKLHGLVRFALDDRHSFTNSIVPEKAGDPKSDQVAAAQLAIDSDVEQSEVSEVAR